MTPKEARAFMGLLQTGTTIQFDLNLKNTENPEAQLGSLVLMGFKLDPKPYIPHSNSKTAFLYGSHREFPNFRVAIELNREYTNNE